VDFASATKTAPGAARGKLTGQQDPHLVGEDLVALVVHHPAAVAVAVEAKGEVGAGLAHRPTHVGEHLQRLGIGVVSGEAVIEAGVEGDHFGADAREDLRGEGACGAVAGGADHAQRTGEAPPGDEVRDIGLGHASDRDAASAGAGAAPLPQHDGGELGHLLGTMRQRWLKAHLHAGPAVGVVAGRHHGDGG
jgi:hypothetical protein